MGGSFNVRTLVSNYSEDSACPRASKPEIEVQFLNRPPSAGSSEKEQLLLIQKGVGGSIPPLRTMGVWCKQHAR